MAKTKTFGVRLTPDMISELERLKDVFAFTSSGEMIESWIRLLKDIDEGVCRIKEHPREWKAHQVEKYLSFTDKETTVHSAQVDELAWRRLRERFGEDGVERIRELVAELHSERRSQSG